LGISSKLSWRVRDLVNIVGLTNQCGLFLVNIIGLANQGGFLDYSHHNEVINLVMIDD